MTKQTRDDLRKLQDKMIQKLIKQGYEDNDQITLDKHGHWITLGDLKQFLYPERKNDFEFYNILKP